MTHTRSKPLALTLSLSLACSLSLPTVASAQEPAADPATTAPIVIVTPAPEPAPAPAPAPVPPPPTYQPTAPVAPPALYMDPHTAALKHQRGVGLGMTISGFTMFGTSYLISALVGTISLDLAADVGGSGKYGRRMLIPVAGPFMAIPRSDTATGGMFTALLGVIQIGGLVLGTAGAIKYSRANRQLRLSADAGGLKLQF